jgi:hypothetical protein
MKKIFAFLSVLFIFSACEKDINLDVPKLSSKLAVHALWVENQVLELSLTRTLNIPDKPTDWQSQEKYYVKNANVIVYQNNLPYDKLTYDEQQRKYISLSRKKAVPGFSYHINVTAPGFEEVIAPVSHFLPKVPIRILEFKKEASKDEFGQKMDELKIEFDDPAQAKNFYQIRIQQSEFESFNTVYPLDKDIVVSLNDDPFSSLPGVESSMIILSDKSFNGQSKRVRILIPSYYLRDYPDANRVKGTVALMSISEEVYQYQRSRILDSENPFAEPVQAISNIKDGVGIFGLLSGEKRSL